ncbi:hypothetical protein [Streptomyces uncialis]|uniref:hypothetical protein n=1 Tax=Streptomyces uncialis TaxID=1048205 RepID=UPI0033FF9F62
MTTNPRANAALVEALGSALREGEHGLQTGPALLVRVLREGSWRSFVTQRGEPVEHRSFEQFVTTPPLKGLGASMRLIEKLVESLDEESSRAEACDLLDQAVQRRAGRPRKTQDDIQNIAPSGTSREAGLRRLRKDRPDLHTEVLAGHLTTHAAMVQAGFRRRTLTIPIDSPEHVAQALRRALSPEDIATLRNLLTDNL